MLKVREVLKVKGPAVQTVGAVDTVADAIRRLTASKIRCLVVTEGDATVVGVVTIRDLLRRLGEHGAPALDAKIGDVMTRDVTTVTPDTSVEEALTLFTKTRFNHLPVEEDGVLVGLVTPSDVLARHLREVQEDASLLSDYIAGRYF